MSGPSRVGASIRRCVAGCQSRGLYAAALGANGSRVCVRPQIGKWEIGTRVIVYRGIMVPT